MTTFVSAYAQSDFFGKLIILGLVALSFLCWVVLIKKIWTTRDAVKSDAFYGTFLKNKEHLLQLEGSDPSNPFQLIFNELKIKTVEILNKNVYYTNKEGGYLSSADLDSVESHVLATISSLPRKWKRTSLSSPQSPH